MRAHKWHGENQTVMLFNLPQPMGLVAVHPARQPAGMAKIIYIRQFLLHQVHCFLNAFKNREPVKNTLLNFCWYACVLLCVCMCGLTIFRWKSLLEEPLFSYLSAFCCGTEVLLMCLPLRLDTGSRPNHLRQRYASYQMEENTHHSVWWKRKSAQMHLISWCTHKIFILEQRANL